MVIGARCCERLGRLATLLLFLAATGASRAEWKVTTTEEEHSPNGLAVHWKTQLVDEATGERATVHAAVFSTRVATLRMIDQPATPRGGLAEVVATTTAVAAVNGGYFNPEDAPIGLLVSDGKVLAPQGRAKLLSGVLFASGNRVDIVRAARFALTRKVQAARQCGPLLVEKSTPVAGLNDTRPARRTFAAVDGVGHAALGVSSAVTLAQLGKILALTNGAGGIKVVRALNLDGGSSSAFWFAGKEGAFSQRELKTVRDFVAIVPPIAR